MTICSNEHKEVCFEGSSCPVCDLKDDYETKLLFLVEVIAKLENKLSDLND